MKTIFALVTALFVGSAFAQGGGDAKHMVQFDLDSTLEGALSFGKSKTPNQDSDNDFQLQLRGNYWYHATQLSQNLQLGLETWYEKDTNNSGDVEDYGAAVGGIWNFSSGGSVDLKNTIYAGLTLGYGWNNNYGASTQGNDDDEVLITSAFVGKRMPINLFNSENFVYTPELAFVGLDSKTGGNVDYSSEVQLRFLQFALLW